MLSTKLGSVLLLYFYLLSSTKSLLFQLKNNYIIFHNAVRSTPSNSNTIRNNQYFLFASPTSNFDSVRLRQKEWIDGPFDYIEIGWWDKAIVRDQNGHLEELLYRLSIEKLLEKLYLMDRIVFYWFKQYYVGMKEYLSREYFVQNKRKIHFKDLFGAILQVLEDRENVPLCMYRHEDGSDKLFTVLKTEVDTLKIRQLLMNCMKSSFSGN